METPPDLQRAWEERERARRAFEGLAILPSATDSAERLLQHKAYKEAERAWLDAEQRLDLLLARVCGPGGAAP